MPTKPTQLAMMIATVCSIFAATGMTCEEQNVPMPVPTPGTEQPGDPNTPTPPDGDPTPEPFKIVGMWKRVSGDFALASEFAGGKVEYLTMRADGTLDVTIRNEQTLALMCFSGLYSELAERSMLMDFGFSGFASAGFQGASLAIYDMPDNDTLEMTENGEVESVFERVAEIPTEDQCKPLIVVDTVDQLPEPDFPTNLVLVNEIFMYANDNVNRELVRVSKNDGMMLAPLAILSGVHQYPITSQGDDLWNQCNCASDTIIERITQASVSVDEVTGTELGLADFDIETAAFDDQNKLLYVAGRDFDLNRNQILKVNAEVEPDVLVEAFEFELPFEAMAFSGDDLYILGGFPYHVYRVNPDTMKVVESFSLPFSFTSEPQGIVVDGETIYLLQDDFRNRPNSGEIVRLERAE